MSGSMKTYQVDYLITIKDQASAALETMATNAAKLSQPLEQFKTAINQVAGEMAKLKRDWSGSLVIKPTVDLAVAAEQLKNLEKLAQQSANTIATMMDRAFIGKSSAKRTKEAIQKDIEETKKALENRTILDKARGKYQKDLTKYENELANIGKKKSPKNAYNTLSSLSTFAKNGDKMKTAAAAVKNLDKNLSNFQSKSVKVKINADTAPAIAAFNALLTTIRETVATVPITITNAANQANKGKSKTSKPSSKTAQSIKADVKKIADNSATALNKEMQKKQNSVSVKMKLDKTGLISQLNTIVAELKEKATAKPIKLKAMLSPVGMVKQFNQIMGEFKAKSAEKPLKLQVIIDAKKAVMQLEKVIGTLQELANTKPILLNASASTTTTAAIDNKKAKGKNSLYPTPSEIAAYDRHASDVVKREIEKKASIAKLEAQDRKNYLAQQQEKYNSLFGREALHQQWLARDKAGESTRAKNIAHREAREARNAASAALHNKAELQRLRAFRHNEIVAQMASQGPAWSGGSGGKNGNGGSVRAAAAKPSLYANMRSFWYPLTGNTSFGARTPMAVDMAKGMGTMFAIGGAMSAVGSSLSQSVNYQNIMKTTQAILQNGTNNYSDGGFKDMEHVVRQVGKETKFTAPQVASAAKFLAMAGYDIPSIKSAINPVANIALIGDTNLGETADKLTNVMTTFGINPEKMNDIADIMTSTFTRSNTDMMMLAESAKYAGGIAHLYGRNFQNNFSDVMAMFGVLGNAGIQASSAGTTLRMMYQNLMQPNKNQKATLKKYGITTRDASGAPLEMIEILKQIYAKVPQKQLADAVGNMFRITAQPGAAALVQSIGSGKLVELMQANRQAAGSGVAQSIADEKKNTLSGLWAQVESTFTEGILQAVEGRQGGWAGMLGQLRDYLAKPETVEMLSNIVDLVEHLMKIIGQFAEIYAKIYHAFPNLINFWMRFQLWATQIGYLVSPLIQMVGLFNMLSQAITGTAAAATAATVAKKAKQAATGGTAAANLLGGAASGVAGRTAATRSSGLLGGLVAANIAGGLVPYTGFKPYKQTIGYTRPDILGPLSLTRAQYWHNPHVTEEMKLYERSRGYMWRGMSKKQKAQLNGTINRQIAALRPKERGVYVPSIIPLNAGFGFANKPIYRHGRELTRGIYYNRAAVSQVMPFNKYASRTGSVLNGGAVLADKAAAYRWRSQKWGSISANQSLSAEQRTLAAARSEKYLNAAIEAETLHQQQMIAQRNAQRARIAQIAAARHAARGPIDSVVRNRFAQRYGFKKAAGMTWSNSFSAGRAMGTLSLASMLTGIKKMALSLFSGLAKAIGLLVSPVGLAVTALTALGVAAFMSYKKSKAHKEQMAKEAERVSDLSEKARQKDLKYGNDLYDKYTKGIWGDHKPVISVSSTPNLGSPKPVVKTEKDKYKDAYSALGMDVANTKWTAKVLASRQARIGFGNDIYKYLGKSLYSNSLKESFGSGANEQDAAGLAFATLFFPDKYTDEDNQRSANARARTSLIYRGAIANSTISARNKVIDLYQKYQSKKIDEKTYKSQAQAILNNAANPNAHGLLDASTYSASQIAKSDPTRFKLYQQGAYNAIMAEIQGSIGSITGLLSAQQQLKDGITQYSNKWYSSIAHIINGMDTSVSTIKGNVTVMLRTLPNGQIDAENIVAQVRQKVSAFKLTMAQFANLITNVYSELIKSGFVKGKYYSDYIRFTTEQLKGRSVTAEDAGNWFDTYIAKGDAKATWGGKDRQSYIDYVVNSKDERAKKERNIIKGSIIRNTAISAKRNTDKLLKSMGVTDGETKDTPNTNNKNTPNVNNNNDNDDKKKQKDYASTYDRSASRPTQVIIHIDNLAKFDNTSISKNANDRAIAEAIETKIADAVSMLSAQILTTASSTISQGLS